MGGTIAAHGGAHEIRRARDRQRGFGPRCRRVRRARGRACRARDEGVDSILQLGEGAGRNPGGFRRGRLARDPCGGRLEELARDGEQGARHGADERGAGRDPLARGARGRVHARERRLPAGEVRRRESQAPASGRRPDRPRDHEGLARGVRGGRWHLIAEVAAQRARAHRERLARPRRRAHRRGRRRRPGGRRPLLPRRGGAWRALDQPPWRDRRGDADRGRPRRRATRFRRTAVPPERRRLAARRCRATRSPRRRVPTGPCS